jgi:Domain of unknown function (DUF4160)
MPTIIRLKGIRFFFYSLENGEPPHVHAESDDKTAKFWLDPVELARSNGFRPQELTRLRAVVIERRREFLEAWHAHFGRSA